MAQDKEPRPQSPRAPRPGAFRIKLEMHPEMRAVLEKAAAEGATFVGIFDKDGNRVDLPPRKKKI